MALSEEDQITRELLAEFRQFDYRHRREMRDRHYRREDGMCAECSIGVRSVVWECAIVQLLKASRRPGEKW